MIQYQRSSDWRLEDTILSWDFFILMFLLMNKTKHHSPFVQVDN